MGEGTDEDHTGEEKSNQRGGQQNLDGLKDVQLTTLRSAMARHAKDKLEPHQFYALPARSSVDVRVPVELPVVDVRASSDDACEAAVVMYVYHPIIYCGPPSVAIRKNGSYACC